MVKSKELTEVQRNTIKVLSEEGYSVRMIAERTGTPKSTVQDTLKRLERNGTLKSLPRSGRPKATNSRLDRRIVQMAENSSDPNAIDIAERLAETSIAQISSQTIRNRLHDNDMYGRVKASKPLLTKKHMARRLEFARKYQNWTISDWKKVLWSDETKISLHGSDGKRYTWRKATERLKPKHVKRTIKYDKSIMVWGCFSWNGVGELNIIDGTMTSAVYVRILKDSMQPSARRLFDESYIFQQDNDPKHTAKNTREWMEREQIEILDWPPQSPDLNPIENLWWHVKQEISKLKLGKLDELHDGLKRAWESISNERCRKLIESMPRRIDQVIKNNGSWTKY